MTRPEEQARDLVEDFVSAVPEAQPIMREHLDDNFNELVPHVLMAALTRWIIHLQLDADMGNTEAGALRDRALAFLEGRFSDVEDVGGQDVIAASFLENLHQAGSALGGLVSHLGPALRAGVSPA